MIKKTVYMVQGFIIGQQKRTLQSPITVVREEILVCDGTVDEEIVVHNAIR